MSLEAKGKMKNILVFQGAKATSKVNIYKKQKDSQTERQLLVRTLFDEARQRWNSLTDEQKSVWNDEAKYKNKTGYDIFIKYSINNLRTMDYSKCLKVDMTRFKKGAKPPLDHIDGLFYCLEFEEVVLEANEQFVFATLHIPKDYKPNSDMGIELNWFSDSEIVGSVKWEISLVSVTPDTADTAEDTPTVETVISVVSPNLGALKITEDAVFSGSLFSDHDVVGIKVKRKSADVADTLTGSAHLLMLEFCYISDRLGEKV